MTENFFSKQEEIIDKEIEKNERNEDILYIKEEVLQIFKILTKESLESIEIGSFKDGNSDIVLVKVAFGNNPKGTYGYFIATKAIKIFKKICNDLNIKITKLFEYEAICTWEKRANPNLKYFNFFCEVPILLIKDESNIMEDAIASALRRRRN